MNILWQNEHYRTIAECYFDLQRIRSARTEVLRRIGEIESAALEAHAAAAIALEKINRYEQRVLSRRRKVVRELRLLALSTKG